MPRDERTTNRPTPGGSAFQETGMDDYLTRVAEAVRDACFEACNENGGDMGAICIIDMPAIIASVPRPDPDFYVLIDGEDVEFNGHDEFSCGRTGGRPLYAEPVAAQPAVPDGWKMVPVEPSIAACIIGSNAAGGAIDGRQCAVVFRAMLAAAPEAPEPVLDRPASIGGTTFGVGIPVRTLVAAAQRRYEVEQTPASLADRQALIDALRRPVVDAEIATLREQNAEMLSALKAIDDLTGRAGFEFGRPLAVAIKEGLGDRGEFFELACIADGYFEAISKHTDNAIASAKGVRNEPCRA